MLSKDEHDSLVQIAAKTDRSMSWLGRYAIKRLIEHYRERQLPLEIEIASRG